MIFDNAADNKTEGNWAPKLLHDPAGDPRVSVTQLTLEFSFSPGSHHTALAVLGFTTYQDDLKFKKIQLPLLGLKTRTTMPFKINFNYVILLLYTIICNFFLKKFHSYNPFFLF